jgi:hypothetical protein
MYHLLRDGKFVATVETFQEAMARAKEESKAVDNGCSVFRNGEKHKGSIVSVWSGPLAPWVEGGKSLRGVTKHASFFCGFIG